MLYASVVLHFFAIWITVLLLVKRQCVRFSDVSGISTTRLIFESRHHRLCTAAAGRHGGGCHGTRLPRHRPPRATWRRLSRWYRHHRVPTAEPELMSPSCRGSVCRLLQIYVEVEDSLYFPEAHPAFGRDNIQYIDI